LNHINVCCQGFHEFRQVMAFSSVVLIVIVEKLVVYIL
jgi:hypothetical protein